jgi:hypothetical protein
MSIPLDISSEIFGSLGGEGSITPVPEDVSLFAMADLTATDTDDYYILTTTRTFERTRIFEINLNEGVAVKLYMDTNYRSLSEHILEAGEDRYTYSLVLLDRHKDEIKLDPRVILRIYDHEKLRRHSMYLPVDPHYLKKDNLWMLFDGWRPETPLWVTLEQADTPGQFLVQTTDELSEEITLTFLVDLELGVIG